MTDSEPPADDTDNSESGRGVLDGFEPVDIEDTNAAQDHDVEAVDWPE